MRFLLLIPVTGNPTVIFSISFQRMVIPPQVKAWLESHLFFSLELFSGSDPSKVSDDLIAEFSRQFG